MRARTYLPFLHIILHGLVLLQQIVQNLPQPFRVYLECRHDLLDRPLDENAVDHAEALAILWEGLERFRTSLVRGVISYLA